RERTDLSLQLSQKRNDVFRLDVLVVFQKREVEVQPRPLGTHRDGADGREAVSAIESREFGRLADRRPSATDGWRQHEAAFIEENQVRMPRGGLLDDARKFVATPTYDGFLVAFSGPLARLLRRPAKHLVQESADVIVMQRD